MITIGKPYIESVEGKVRLCSVVNYDGTDEVIWYGVEEKYSKYLCVERADAFLLAFLPYAMAFKKDIKIEFAVSEKLYYQLNHYYIPSLAKFSNYYSAIKIECDYLDSTDYVNKQSAGVATGFSGGVDSFFTVLKHLNCKEESFRLTHLTFSAVLALQKLFRVYYYSSTATVRDFSFNVVDCANFDSFNLSNFTVEGVHMYSVGLDCERLDKQRFIQDFPETYKYLNVCNREAMNCSRCEKCLRTMAGFHCLGTLEKYSDVFDVKYYQENFSKCMGLLLGKRFDGSAEGNIDAVLIKNMKKAGIHIPIGAYLKSVPHAIRSLAYKYARKIKPIRKWYHKKMNEELGCNYQDN